MKTFPHKLLIVAALFSLTLTATAQSFLHVEDKKTVNGAGENVILRGIGTGNWLLMEGYMMKTEGVAGTQHEIRNKLNKLIGEAKTKEFFDIWLENHFTKTDVDSMKAWGFNSIRVAMHYKWFTLPIEEEPVTGQNTWIYKGFKIIDNLLDWCEANEMYLILDLHAAPGGQGKNADISDYDPTKPSLWESEQNKDKMVALWRKLAQRYSNEPWIGGYDLLNETNWAFPEGNNSQMRALFSRVTEAIREVDNNHIIFIEGNSFANDFSGLTPPWDDNMVYSFHKYWSGTSDGDLDWVLTMRDEYNVPLWLGESGENSNTWFTELVATCENNNIGWSWWPVKKNGINNVLHVPINKSYENLVKYWKGENNYPPSAEDAFDAVVQWSENHKIENCKVQYDVIDALIRQPHTDEVMPYKEHQLTQPIYFSDFDFGKNKIAYYDKDVGHYGGDWTAWNTGWGVRNDGVDIEACNDDSENTNGYSVGWTEDGEWMQYTLNSDSTAIYTLTVRHASNAAVGSKFSLQINDADVTGELTLPKTGGWQTWQTATFKNILIPAGKIRIKYVNNKGGSNLSYFQLSNPTSAKDVVFKALSAHAINETEIRLSLNKNLTNSNEEININNFRLFIDGTLIDIQSITRYAGSSTELVIKFNKAFHSDNVVTISYLGESIKSGNQKLQAFSDLKVENNLPVTHKIPGKVEAEAFFYNNGLSIENCTDEGGGQNTGYSAPGEYLDYKVHITKTGFYAINYRVATEHSDAEVVLQVGDGENFTPVDTLKFSKTGGWQKWQTQTSEEIRLEKGYYFIRLLIKKGEHNLNWFQVNLITSTSELKKNRLLIYPNPANNVINIKLADNHLRNCRFQLINMQGMVVKSLEKEMVNLFSVALNDVAEGNYLVRITDEDKLYVNNIIVKH